MSQVHDSNVWALDRRQIDAACLTGHPARDILLACDGWRFERFERNGEMAPIPYLRATNKDGETIEAALRDWRWVELQEISE